MAEAKNTIEIPIILYYNELGNVRAAGAEALSDNIQHEAEENDCKNFLCWGIIDFQISSSFISIRESKSRHM